MSFEFADNITSIVLNAVLTLALAGLLLLLGYYVRQKIPALSTYSIPAPVRGGPFSSFRHACGGFSPALSARKAARNAAGPPPRPFRQSFLPQGEDSSNGESRHTKNAPGVDQHQANESIAIPQPKSIM